MSRCHFCDHNNPANATKCVECGAELPREGDNDSTATRGESPPAAQPNPTEATELERRILVLLQGSGKISAIKEYREATGVGLKDAKDHVEFLARKHGVQGKANAGCASVLLLAVLPALVASVAVALWVVW
jgi:hypothetical protein